jgi:Rhodanese-like domain
MRYLTLTLIVFVGLPSIGTTDSPKNSAPANPAIDMEGYLKVSREAAKHRETRRLSEAEFLRMSAEPGTIVLDARSKEKYDELHIRGAINLSFSDIAVESLKKTLPDKEARILIYCNNNFKNAEGPFPTKKATASLNLSTYIALYQYGYRNLYKLGPHIDPKESKLPFESATARR